MLHSFALGLSGMYECLHDWRLEGFGFKSQLDPDFFSSHTLLAKILNQLGFILHSN